MSSLSLFLDRHFGFGSKEASETLLVRLEYFPN